MGDSMGVKIDSRVIKQACKNLSALHGGVVTCIIEHNYKMILKKITYHQNVKREEEIPLGFLHRDGTVQYDIDRGDA